MNRGFRVSVWSQPMSLSRSLSRFLLSNRSKYVALRFPSFSTATQTKSPTNRAKKRNPKPSAFELPRPSVIPFQATVANSVHLVGSIGVPVQLLDPQGRRLCEVTILVLDSRKEGSPLWIPVIFQGDLAQSAAFYLKESDLIYVTGKFCGGARPQTIEDKSQKAVEDAQSRIQVLASSLSFVQKTCPEKTSDMVFHQGVIVSDPLAKVEEGPSSLHLWNDLLAHPRNWWDNRSLKYNPKGAAFKHKKSGEQLWIDDSTPEWVLSKLDTLSCARTYSGGTIKPDRAEGLWRDLVDNPQQWQDKRGDKVSPKHPDFTQKGTNKGLWLTAAPKWLAQRVDGPVFCGSNRTTKHERGNSKDEMEKLWRDLVEHPNKWWDNRSRKFKPNYPDFAHKDTGKALWLGSSTPGWVWLQLPALPPAK